MSEVLHLLIIEDDLLDAELAVRTLEKAGFECQWDRVETREGFLTRILDQKYDLILADYNVPRFGGLEALRLCLERNLDTPFIIISGAIGEETGIETLKAGATDYVHKDRLSRLVPVVQRALKEKEDQRQRKKAEQELQFKNVLLSTQQETALDGILIVDRQGQILSYNQRFVTLWDIPSEVIHSRSDDLALQSILSKLPDPEGFIDRVKFLYDHPHENSQDEIALIDGKTFERYSSPLIDSQGENLGRIWYFRDITERKKAEQAVRESEKRYRALFEMAGDAIFILEAEGPESGRILAANQAAARMHGYSVAELQSMNIKDLDTPEAAQEISGRLERMVQGEWITAEILHRRKDGTLFPVEISAGLLEIGHHKVILAFDRDITERTQARADKEKMEKRLQEAQKLEAMGTLAGGIAHDFNNILSAIIGYTELMKMTGISPENPQSPYLEGILKAGDRAKDLVSQILTFSQEREKEKRPVQLSTIINEVLKFLRASLPSTVILNQVLKKETRPVLADSTQIHQILMNLCTNAAHALRGKGGVLEVGLTEVELDIRQTAQYPEVIPGIYAKLTVKDSGHGMSPEVVERIFEPYFTTKTMGEGSGLGLAVTHGIVKNHNGMINVRSALGKGTIFEVYLPVYTHEVKGPVSSIQPPLPRGNERILFVDDEQPILEIGEKLLKKLGYAVDSRTSSLEALEVFRAKPDSYDLVVTDLTMPHLTGDRFAKELLAIRSDIPIILCTGYSEMDTRVQIKKIGVMEFLIKPLTVHKLSETIRKTLDRAKVEK